MDGFLEAGFVHVKKEDDAEGLVLDGCGNASFDNEMGDELVDFSGAHLAGVAFDCAAD